MDRLSTVSKILQLREMKKEEIELEVKNINRLIEIAQARLDFIEREFIESSDDFERRQRDGDIKTNEMELFYDYFTHLDDEINTKRKEITRKIFELNRLKAELLEAYKDKKVFEMLKERIVGEEAKEKEAGEQKEMDFLFLSRRRKNE